LRCYDTLFGGIQQTKDFEDIIDPRLHSKYAPMATAVVEVPDDFLHDVHGRTAVKVKVKVKVKVWTLAIAPLT